MIFLFFSLVAAAEIHVPEFKFQINNPMLIEPRDISALLVIDCTTHPGYELKNCGSLDIPATMIYNKDASILSFKFPKSTFSPTFTFYEKTIHFTIYVGIERKRPEGLWDGKVPKIIPVTSIPTEVNKPEEVQGSSAIAVEETINSHNTVSQIIEKLKQPHSLLYFSFNSPKYIHTDGSDAVAYLGTKFKNTGAHVRGSIITSFNNGSDWLDNYFSHLGANAPGMNLSNDFIDPKAIIVKVALSPYSRIQFQFDGTFYCDSVHGAKAINIKNRYVTRQLRDYKNGYLTDIENTFVVDDKWNCD